MVSRLTRAIDAFAGDAGRLAHAQAEAVAAAFPAYRDGRVPPAALLASALHNVTLIVAVLRHGRAPDRAQLDEAARTRARTGQGIPADQMHDAYRLCLRLLVDAFVDHAVQARVGQAEILSKTRLLWESADVLTSAVVGAREAAERAVEQGDGAARAALVRDFLLGSLPPALLRERAARAGLSVDRGYYVLRARATGTTTAAALVADLARACRTRDGRPLVVELDDEVVGIVTRRPLAVPAGCVVGVGGPQALSALPHAHAQANRVWEVATAFGLEGAFELGDLSLRVAIAAEPDLGVLLFERHLAPLRRCGDFGGELERTLRQYLQCRANIPSTAAALGLHPNTVRHRLARIGTLTGADLDDFAALVEIWWALHWLDHAPSA